MMLDDKDGWDTGHESSGVWVPYFVGDFVWGAFSGVKQPVPQGHDEEGKAYPWWFYIKLLGCELSDRHFWKQRSQPGFFKTVTTHL